MYMARVLHDGVHKLIVAESNNYLFLFHRKEGKSENGFVLQRAKAMPMVINGSRA